MKKLLADFLGIKEEELTTYNHIDNRANTYAETEYDYDYKYLSYYTTVEEPQWEVIYKDSTTKIVTLEELLVFIYNKK